MNIVMLLRLKKTTNFLFCCFVLLCILQCKYKTNNQKKPTQVSEKENSYELMNFEKLPEEFQLFYEKFHADSLFQVAHIIFPLQGLPDNADPEYIAEEAFFWTPDQWRYQNGKGLQDNNFERRYTNLADVLIEERILDKVNDLMIIRRYSKSGDSWQLIYYAGLNRYKTKG